MSRFLTLSLVLALAFGGFGWLLAGQPASAAPDIVFSLNSTLDEADASPHDGACLSTPSGLCTLRAAVQQANHTSGPDTILLQPGLTYRLTLPGLEDQGAQGDLDLSDDLTLAVQGDGRATVDGNGAVTGDKVFSIGANASVSMTGLVIEGGRFLGPGGGLYNAGTLTLIRVTVRDNTAESLGGGILNAGSLSVSSSTISGNHASVDGGGIHQVTYTATLSLISSTLSGNTADGFGGGLYVISGTVNLASTTLAYNRADYDMSGNGSGGGIYRLNGQINLKNSLLAQNRRGLLLGSVADDCVGTLVSGDYNLLQTTAGCVFEGTIAHHQTGVNPLLGPLQDNGGPTETHALLDGSPALDAGNPAGCRGWGALPLLLNVDQRGLGRYADGDVDGSALCDIGAFEYHPPVAITPTPPTATPSATPPAGGSATEYLYLPVITR